jgi:hypothetical protein
MHEDYKRKKALALPSNKSFGMVFTLFFSLVALGPLFSGHKFRSWALVLAVVVALVSLFYPKALTPFNFLWMKFGDLLHKVISPIILGLLYYLAVVPTGLLLRLAGKDILLLRKETSLNSYWIARSDTSSNNLTKQF